MVVEAVRFDSADEELIPKLYRIEIENEEDLLELKDGEQSLIYIIADKNLKTVTQHGSLVENRQHKEGSIELMRCFKNVADMAAITANYSSHGRLKRSLGAFLERIKGEWPPKVYFIAVSENLLGRLREDAGEAERNRTVAWKGVLEDFRSFPGSMMRLMKCEPIPVSLVKAYIGNAARVEYVRQMILRCSQTDNTVLIAGDTGTGKEIAARQVHDLSKRKTGRFVAVNCAAIPENMLESELFGHEAGAFTNALKQKIGLWQMANKGTLFLDEIGDLSLNHQVKILRALQEGVIRRVGGLEELPIDARIIAATNRDLASLVQTGRFREDLYYRLRQLIIITPPLRSHLEDIPMLVTIFWKKLDKRNNLKLSGELIEALQQYAWPGNVRELKSVLNSLYSNFPDAGTLGAEHLYAVSQLYGQSIVERTDAQAARDLTVENWRYLRRLLDAINAAEYVLQRMVMTTTGEAPAGEIIEGADMDLVESFNYRMEELKLYCENPDPFDELHGGFIAVNELKARLMLFGKDFGKNSASAFSEWHSDIRARFENAKKILVESMNRLIEKTVRKKSTDLLNVPCNESAL